MACFTTDLRDWMHGRCIECEARGAEGGAGQYEKPAKHHKKRQLRAIIKTAKHHVAIRISKRLNL
ncbi:MAG: hypothetical protein LBR89_00135 [Holosporales bacterium]|nr:hypothetical protein [Holosporales bacterium]